MSRWDRWGWYSTPPKKPPPAHGIKVKKSGTTWWGRRWIEALERMSAGYSSRLARGRTYARAGRTHDLVVKAGKVTARVTGSRTTPYKVQIALVQLPSAVWSKAIAAMASQARFSAELLAGQMPQEIDAAFQAAKASLFPLRSSDLQTECSCPDWANPCKHVAATHYVLGEALDRDPFLLFELRGRTRDQVLEGLRAARAEASGDSAAGNPGRPKKGVGKARSATTPAKGARKGKRGENEEAREISVEELPGVSLGKLRSADYDRPCELLPDLELGFAIPPVPGAMLRQLGAPAGWSEAASPEEFLAPMIRAAARSAQRLAMREIEDEPKEMPDEDPQPSRAPESPRRKKAVARKPSRSPRTRNNTTSRSGLTSRTRRKAKKKARKETNRKTY